MSNNTFRNFSLALCQFHCVKAGGSLPYDSIESLCEKATVYFMNELDKVDECEFKHTHLSGKEPKTRKYNLIKWLSEIIISINRLVKDESDNCLNAACELYGLLFNKNTGLPKFKHLTSVIKSHTNFYRVRNAERYEIYDRKGMFVLSDRLEHLVGSYRFNPSGYACLYLASNLYLAWEECRRPYVDTFNFSLFQNARDVEVLDLTIRRDYHYREHFLLAYLTLLCSAKTTDSDKHKFQYVVPQMLMKVLCASQRDVEKKSKDKVAIAGIKYMSSRWCNQKDLLFDEIKLTEAYVFPQHPHSDKDEVCPFLAKLFKLTEPKSYFLLKSHRLQFFNRTAYVSDYQDSLFYRLEESLKGDKLARYNE